MPVSPSLPRHLVQFARYNDIDLEDASVNGGELDNITVGVNWYLNTNARVMVNYFMADLEREIFYNDRREAICKNAFTTATTTAWQCVSRFTGNKITSINAKKGVSEKTPFFLCENIGA